MKSITITLKHVRLSTTRNNRIFIWNRPPYYMNVVKITSCYMKDMSNIPENKMRKLQIKVRSDWEKYST